MSGLTSLTSLNLGGNAIKDIAPLAPLIKRWTLLSSPRNQIKDLSPPEKVTKLLVPRPLRTIRLENVGFALQA